MQVVRGWGAHTVRPGGSLTALPSHPPPSPRPGASERRDTAQRSLAHRRPPHVKPGLRRHGKDQGSMRCTTPSPGEGGDLSFSRYAQLHPSSELRGRHLPPTQPGGSSRSSPDPQGGGRHRVSPRVRSRGQTAFAALPKLRAGADGPAPGRAFGSAPPTGQGRRCC